LTGFAAADRLGCLLTATAIGGSSRLSVQRFLEQISAIWPCFHGLKDSENMHFGEKFALFPMKYCSRFVDKRNLMMRICAN